MPQRRHARPLRAHPDPSTVLPPQPVADRDRPSRVRRLIVAAVAIGVSVAVVVPLAFAVLRSNGSPISPPGGGVAGAVSATRVPVAGATTPPGSIALVPESRVPAARSTDADGAPTHRDFFVPPISSLTGYVWPIRAGRISLPFKAIPGGTRIKDGKLFHDGVDMASF